MRQASCRANTSFDFVEAVKSKHGLVYMSSPNGYPSTISFCVFLAHSLNYEMAF